MANPSHELIGSSIKRRRIRLSMPGVIGVVVIFLIFTTVAFPTMCVVFVGMIPTLVCYIVDLTPGRYAFRCVASMNFAGVAPFVRLLWSQGHDMSSAMGIIGDPFSWLVFYGTAAFGWGLFLWPPFHPSGSRGAARLSKGFFDHYRLVRTSAPFPTRH